MSEVNYTLTKPVITGKGEIKELVLKTPTARMFIAYGNPFVDKYHQAADGTPGGFEMQYNDRAIMAFLENMSGIASESLELIDAYDYVQLRGVVRAMVNCPS